MDRLDSCSFKAASDLPIIALCLGISNSRRCDACPIPFAKLRSLATLPGLLLPGRVFENERKSIDSDFEQVASML